VSTVDATPRPARACLLCPPPRTDGAWRLADDSYRTCSGCLDRLREALKDIAKRYAQLDPTPGASGEHGTRGAPGFGSRSPASEHILCMTDRRSSPVARTWLGADGRLHCESERPPLSVHNVLDTAAWAIAEERGIDGPGVTATVDELTRWIDVQLDWATRNDIVTDLWADLRALLAQLKPVTGEPGRRRVGTCPNTIDEGDETRPCEAPLFAPLNSDVIKCRACGREWHRPEWEQLGQLLQQETLQRAS
jgi:hypothetical protein